MRERNSWDWCVCWYKTYQYPLKWQELLSLACLWPVGMKTLPVFQEVLEIQICMGILWWLKWLSAHACTLFRCWQLISIKTLCRQNKAHLWPWWLPVCNIIGLFFSSWVFDPWRFQNACLRMAQLCGSVTVSHKVEVKLLAVAASPEGLAEAGRFTSKMAPSQGRRSPYLALSLS